MEKICSLHFGEGRLGTYKGNAMMLSLTGFDTWLAEGKSNDTNYGLHEEQDIRENSVVES